MGLGSGIRFRIPDPEVKNAPARIRNTVLNYQNFALNRTCSIITVAYILASIGRRKGPWSVDEAGGEGDVDEDVEVPPSNLFK